MKKVHYLLSLQCALQLAFSGSVIAQTVSAPVQTTQAKSSATVPVNLDLTSTAKTITPGNLAGRAVNINVGGKTLQVTNSTLLTPSERLAVYQVWSTGNQTIQLGALGNATGGTFNMGSRFNQYVSSLVVPHGVTAIQNVSSLSSLNLNGNLTNAGNFYAVSTNANLTGATINAANILNQKGGLISSVVPASGISGVSGTLSPVNLSLNAVNSIVNSGVISSSGNLSLTAGNSITNALPAGVSGAAPIIQAAGSLNLATNQLTNAGLISATNGNINLVSVNNGSIQVNNSNGIMQALAGSLNVRDALFSEKSNFTLTGGQLLAPQTNIFSGDGIVSLDAEKISGLLNVNGGEAHVLVNSGDLNLGKIDLSGDPNFYASSGSLSLSSDLIYSGQNLALVAAGDITATTAGVKIDTSSSTGAGGAITLVAGANFTVNTPGSSGKITITKGSATGGKIDLATNAIAKFDSSSSISNGGAVNLVAFAGTGTGSGSIFFPTDIDIKTSGASGSSNGNVTVIAGGDSDVLTAGIMYKVAISLGGINASGAGSGGNINLTAATPTTISPVIITNGKITGGSFGTGAATVGRTKLGSLTVGSPMTCHGINTDGNLNVSGGGTIETSGTVTVKGNITETELLANGGNIYVGANMVAQGSINLTTLTGTIATINVMISNPSVELNAFGAALTPDGRYAFVPNSGSNTVSVIDTSTNTVLPAVDISPYGSQPKGAVVSPDGTRAYVVCNSPIPGQGTVVVIDTASRTVLNTITFNATGPAGDFDPQTVAIAPDGQHIYVLSDYAKTGAATANNQVTVIDTSNTGLQTNISLSGGTGSPGNLGGIVINPKGTFAYTANSGSNNISVIDLSNNSVAKTIDLSGSGLSGCNPLALNFDPSGTKLYIGESDNKAANSLGQILVVDTRATSSAYNQLLPLASQQFGPSADPIYNNPGFAPQAIALCPTGTQLFANPTNWDQSVVFSPIAVDSTNILWIVTAPLLPSGSTAPSGYGSSTFSTVITNSGVRNEQTYITCPTLTGSAGTVAVLQRSTIQGANISLSSKGGDILVNYDVRGGTFTANTNGMGTVVAGNVGVIPSKVGNSSSETTVQIGSLSNINITGTISSPIVVLQTTANNASINLNASIGLSTGSVGIYTNGSGAITQGTSGKILGKTVILGSDSGDMGTSSAPLQTALSNLSIQTSGGAWLSNSTLMTLNNCSIGNSLSVIAKGALTVPGSTTIAAGKDLTLSATSITSPADSLLQSPSICLLASGGNILASFDTQGGTFAARTTGTGFLKANNLSTAPSSLGASSAGGLLQILSAGSLHVTGAISAPQVILQTTANNSGISVDAIIGLSSSTVSLLTNGTGVIAQGAYGKVLGTKATLSSDSGDIGASGTPLQTALSNLSISTAGGAWLANSSSLTLNTSTTGTSLSYANKGAVTVPTSATITAGKNLTIGGTSITTATGSLLDSPAITLSTNSGSNGAITLNGQAGKVGNLKSAGSTASITTDGTGAISQGAGTYQIEAESISLNSSSGSAGSAAMPIRINAARLTVSTTGTSVYLNNTGAVTLINASSAQNFNLASSDGITIASGATVTGKTSVTLKATASTAQITQEGSTGTTTVFSPRIVLSAGSLGCIGDYWNKLTLAATPTGASVQTINLTANAGNVHINSNNSVAGTNVVNAVLSGISSSGDAGFNLISTGNITFSSASQIKSSGPVLIAGASITQAAAGTVVMIAPVIQLQTSFGDIGTQTISLGINSGVAGKPVVLNAQSGKDVYAAALTLNSVQGALVLMGTGNSASGKFVITAAGNLEIGSNALVQAGSCISLTTNGTSLSQEAASGYTTLFAPTITLTATGAGANIGATNFSIGFAQDTLSPSQNITLTARAPGAVYLNAVNSGVAAVNTNLAGANSAGADFTFVGSGTLNINSGAKVSATNGSIALSSWGSISQSAQGTPLTAPTVKLRTIGGSIGSALTSIGMSGTKLATIDSGWDAYVTAGGALTLGNSNTSKSLNLIAAGAITTTGSQTVGTSMLLKSTSSGAITLGSTISAASVTLYTGGAIAQSGSTQLSAGTISFTGPTAAGPISVGASGKPLLTATNDIHLPAAGQVWISNVGDLNLPASAFTGTAFSLITQGALATNAAINAPTIKLGSSSAGANVTLGADVGSSSSNVVLSVEGTGGGNLSQSAGVVKGTNLNVSGGSGSVTLNTSVTNLTLNEPGTANISNAAATTIQGLSGGTITVSSAGALTVKGAVNGTSIDLSTTGTGAGITISAPINAATVSLKSTGTGAIAIGNNVGQAGGTTTISAPGTGSLTLTGTYSVLGKDVTLKATGGNIGATGAPVRTQTDNLTLSAGGSALVANSATADFTLQAATTGGALTVSDSGGSLSTAPAGSITVGSNTPANLLKTSNNLTLTETGTAGPGGAMFIGGNVNVYGGKIVIQTTNTISGYIYFAFSARVNTLVDHSTALTNGTITAAVGPLPTTRTNPGQANFPGLVTVSTTSPGQAYAGPYPGALIGPSKYPSAVNAAGRDIIFSSTSASRTITLGDDSVITADPPGAGSATSSLASGLAVSAGTGRLANSMPQAPPQSVTSKMLFTDSRDLLPGNAPITPTLNIAELSTRQIGSDDALDTTPAIGAVQTHTTRENPGNLHKQILLEERSMLLVPEQPATIRTSFGNVILEKGAVAYVVAAEGTLAVYDLHDSRAGDVSVMIGGNKHMLSPGEHLLITNEPADSYEQLNPVASISHRNLQSGILPSTQRFFSSRFSLTSAISGLKEVSALKDSKNVRDRRIYKALIKNAAILLQTQAGGSPYARITNAAKFPLN